MQNKSAPSVSPKPGDKDLVVMARIAAPFGIKGWVKLLTFTDSPDSLDAYATWLVRKNPQDSDIWEEVELEDFAVNVKAVVAKFKGCDDRTAAERFAKRDIAIPREALGEAGEGEVFWLDLIGSEVVNSLGEQLGQVDTLMQTGANDVLVVKGESGEILIPFVADVIVKVDRHAKVVTVDWGKDY